MKILKSELKRLIAEVLLKESERKIGQYKVRQGDTLSQITKDHSPKGTTIEDNAKLNNMKDASKIQVGKVIKIYVTDEYEGYAN